MTTLSSSIAATLIAISSAAIAAPLPSSTDEARALARPGRQAVATMSSGALPGSTDQARALDASRSTIRALCDAAVRAPPTTSDEARAVAARSVPANVCVATR